MCQEEFLLALSAERSGGRHINRLPGICTAFAFAELGAFYYALCNYRLAYQCATLALEQICSYPTSPRVVAQVMRLVSRICIIRRKYALAMKITQWLAEFVRLVLLRLVLICPIHIKMPSKILQRLLKSRSIPCSWYITFPSKTCSYLHKEGKIAAWSFISKSSLFVHHVSSADTV